MSLRYTAVFFSYLIIHPPNGAIIKVQQKCDLVVEYPFFLRNETTCSSTLKDLSTNIDAGITSVVLESPKGSHIFIVALLYVTQMVLLFLLRIVEKRNPCTSLLYFTMASSELRASWEKMLRGIINSRWVSRLISAFLLMVLMRFRRVVSSSIFCSCSRTLNSCTISFSAEVLGLLMGTQHFV